MNNTDLHPPAQQMRELGRLRLDLTVVSACRMRGLAARP